MRDDLTLIAMFFGVISSRFLFQILQSFDYQRIARRQKAMHILDEENLRFEFANQSRAFVNFHDKN